MRVPLCAGMAVMTLNAAVVAPLAADAPPVAPVRTVTDQHWGVTVADPYRYMENLSDPEVQAWFKGQAEYTESVLSRIPGREAMRQRLEELDAAIPYKVWGVQRMPDGQLFYNKQAADENLHKLYRRESLTGDEHLLIDPSRIEIPGGGHVSLYFSVASPSGKMLIYGLAASGSEDVTLHVYDVTTGKTLPDSITRLEPYYTPPQWLPNESGFFYTRLRQLAPEDPPTEGYKLSKTYLHRLGTDVDDDPVVFAKDLWPGIEMTDEDFPSLVLTPGSDFVIGKIKHGDANQLTLYSARLDDLLNASDVTWQLICDVPDSVVDFAVHTDQIYLITSLDAPRFRLVSTSLSSPDFAAATEIIPASPTVLRSVSAAADALYLGALNAGMDQVVRVDYETLKPRRLTLPDDAPAGRIVSVSPDVPGVYIGTYSWIRRGQTYAYDPDTDSFTNTNLNPPSEFDNVPGLESVEVLVPSHDGVEVPLSIIYNTDIVRDGSNPTLLSGYGSYGISLRPSFDPANLAWLERGGVLAIAHVRGGGEYGQEWHLAGQKLNKPNTWKDFIACAEYLIREGYTSPGKLAGRGGSAGGILIGRAITERPDLFGAAQIAVGSLDMIRMETTTNGVPNIQEFGTVTKEDEFHALLKMSSYHNVKDGVAYPAVILTHGINDPRVEPWMSAKMCARLQAANVGDNPILFRVEYHAGHGIGSTKTQQTNQQADIYSFFLWQMGEEGFVSGQAGE
ncbi:MAG: prolyl oligopeptidase family serine peptidase [Candidatus Zixiibacteriota bacterium]